MNTYIWRVIMKNFKMLMTLILALILMAGCTKTSMISSSNATPEESVTVQEDMTQQEEEPNEEIDDPDDLFNLEPDIRDECYTVMIAYMHFVDQYCDFMQEYAKMDVYQQAENMDKYLDYNERIAGCQEGMAEILAAKDELTDDEYRYCLKVQTQVSAKLLEASGSILSGVAKGANEN